MVQAAASPASVPALVELCCTAPGKSTEQVKKKAAWPLPFYETHKLGEDLWWLPTSTTRGSIPSDALDKSLFRLLNSLGPRGRCMLFPGQGARAWRGHRVVHAGSEPAQAQWREGSPAQFQLGDFPACPWSCKGVGEAGCKCFLHPPTKGLRGPGGPSAKPRHGQPVPPRPRDAASNCNPQPVQSDSGLAASRCFLISRLR